MTTRQRINEILWNNDVTYGYTASRNHLGENGFDVIVCQMIDGEMKTRRIDGTFAKDMSQAVNNALGHAKSAKVANPQQAVAVLLKDKAHSEFFNVETQFLGSNYVDFPSYASAAGGSGKGNFKKRWVHELDCVTRVSVNWL